MRLSILKRITYNWHIKLLSLILGFLLWLYVDGIREKERFLSVPTKIINVPQDHLVVSSTPESVKIVLKGRESNLALVDEGMIEAYIDLENSTELETRRRVKIDMNSIPQGVSIKEISPRIIEVRLERMES